MSLADKIQIVIAFLTGLGVIALFLFRDSFKQLKFDNWLKLQATFMEDDFTKNREIIFRRLDNLESPWSKLEKAAARDVCRKMEELAQLVFYFGVDRALKYWDDPIAKSWIVLEAYVEEERRSVKWDDKWKGFSDLGKVAVNKLRREKRLPLNLTHDYNEVDNTENKHWLYQITEDPAETVKIILQMIVGIILSILLIIKLVGWGFHLGETNAILQYLAHNNVLDIIGKGLAVSAGIELIYMLFTDGPDEAVQPLIYGVASIILIMLSQREAILQTDVALSILAYSFVLALLFYLQREFIANKARDDS